MRVWIYPPGILLLLCTVLFAQDLPQPVVGRFLPPQGAPSLSVAEALAIGLQANRGMTEAVTEKELAAVHNEDLTLSATVSSLMTLASSLPPERAVEIKGRLLLYTRQVADLHVVADAFDQKRSEAALIVANQTFAKIKTFYTGEALDTATTLAARYTCMTHAEVRGVRQDPCPKCGFPLDQMLRPSLLQPGAFLQPTRTVRTSVSLKTPLEVGRPVEATLHLSRLLGGEPIAPAELRPVRMKRLRLFLADQSLSDFQQIFPQTAGSAGDYEFTFTPGKPGSYIVWVEVRTVSSGFQEFAMTELVSDQPAAAVDKSARLESTIDRAVFQLGFAPSPKPDQPAQAKLVARFSPGETALPFPLSSPPEFVAIGEDRKTIIHGYPTDMAPSEKTGEWTGGYVFCFPRVGFYRVFFPMQGAGASRGVSFGVVVDR